MQATLRARILQTLSWMGIVALTVYGITRLYFQIAASYSVADQISSGLLVVAELFLLLQALGFLIHTIRLRHRSVRTYQTARLDPEALPKVAVFVAARHEPPELVELALITLSSLDYPNKEIYLLDGSSREFFLRRSRSLAKKYGVHYFHPSECTTKAAIVNKAARHVDAEYLALFDVDQNPLPDFLRKTIAIAAADKKIAFVQAPQIYFNIGDSPIARGAAMQQSIFYESICEAKSSLNAMFCCGTNVLIRRAALLAVGGFDEHSITEDFATSVRFHVQGYRSVYYNHVRVFGMAPESFPAYIKQQARWAGGTTGVLRQLISLFIRNPRALTFWQWWEYFLSGSYYLVGWSVFITMLSPVVYLLFHIPSFFMSERIYLLTFLPYFLFTLTVFFQAMGERHYRARAVFEGITLAMLSFPTLLPATLAGLTNQPLEFIVTPKKKGGRLSFIQLWPWHLALALNLSAIFVGLFNLRVLPYAALVNIVWCLYHTLILVRVYSLNRASRAAVPIIKTQPFQIAI